MTIEKWNRFGADKLPDYAPEMVLKPMDIEANTIVFHINEGTTEVLKFCENGDIFIQGRLAENDKDVVEGMRKFLMSVNK